MTTDELRDAFERHRGEFLKFDRIANPAHRRPDLCAFLMLDAAVEKRNGSGTFSDMIADARHDEFYLEITPADLAPVATDEMIRDLVRCGIRYESEYNCFAMFT